jgi:hypothetical protein
LASVIGIIARLWRAQAAEQEAMVDSGKSSGKKKKSLLLGLGLDGKDGHVRLTRGENFRLVGGSQETHEQMQEVAIKLNEKLSSRGKQLEEIDPQEFRALAEEVGLRPLVRPPEG